MKVIGFTNKYYTLWEVSEPYIVYVSRFEYYEKQDFGYIQNLSMDLEKAKAKLEGSDYRIDLELKGQSSFTRQSEKINNCPINLFAFGKYSGQDIMQVNDLPYAKWYYEQTQNELAKQFLLYNGYTEYENRITTQEERDFLISKARKLELLQSLEKGSFFEDGQKIELEVRKISAFSIQGVYGYSWIIEFETKCGKLVKHIGQSNPEDFSDTEFQKIKATVKHAHYNGDETRLLRIKLL